MCCTSSKEKLQKKPDLGQSQHYAPPSQGRKREGIIVGLGDDVEGGPKWDVPLEMSPV